MLSVRSRTSLAEGFPQGPLRKVVVEVMADDSQAAMICQSVEIKVPGNFGFGNVTFVYICLSMVYCITVSDSKLRTHH